MAQKPGSGFWRMAQSENPSIIVFLLSGRVKLYSFLFGKVQTRLTPRLRSGQTPLGYELGLSWRSNCISVNSGGRCYHNGVFSDSLLAQLDRNLLSLHDKSLVYTMRVLVVYCLLKICILLSKIAWHWQRCKVFVTFERVKV